jgi:hypothetical protein
VGLRGLRDCYTNVLLPLLLWRLGLLLLLWCMLLWRLGLGLLRRHAVIVDGVAEVCGEHG